MTDIYNDIQTEPIPYYLLDTGEVYDRKKKIFVTKETDTEYKKFLEQGNSPLSINDTGYTREQLIETVLKEYHWEVGDCLLTFEQLKAKKLQELATASAAFEQNPNNDMYFTSSLGFKCNGDRRTLTNIESLISKFDLVANKQTKLVAYRDYDNTDRQVSKAQLETLSDEHVLNGFALYDQKRALGDRISKAKSIEELNKIKITFTMMDFSNVRA